MTSLLEKIVDVKKREVARKKRYISIDDLQMRPLPELRGFSPVFEKNGLSIIAEIKRKSPSAGLIRIDFDPIRIAKIYEMNGGDAVSILTDQTFFGGADHFVSEVKEHITLPILRKEFIVDEYQIFESRSIGSDAILLIVRILTKKELKRFIGITEQMGMSCLVEVHCESELNIALDAGARIIGINNRDLDTLQIDLEMSFRLRDKIPSDVITISESGIKTCFEMEKLKKKGFNGVLIGETLMCSENIGKALRTLKGMI